MLRASPILSLLSQSRASTRESRGPTNTRKKIYEGNRLIVSLRYREETIHTLSHTRRPLPTGDDQAYAPTSLLYLLFTPIL